MNPVLRKDSRKLMDDTEIIRQDFRRLEDDYIKWSAKRGIMESANLPASHRVREVMDSKPPVLKMNTPLMQMFQTAAESDSLFYPVVDEGSRLVGMISFMEVKNLFVMEGLQNLILAYDLMEKIHAVTVPEERLVDALEKMRDEGVEVLPVVSTDKESQLVGMIEQRRIRKALQREII
jgi:CBS domain-containing protein